MIKSCKVLLAILLFAIKLSAQKKEIDFNAIKNWVSLGGYGISNNGRFIWYSQGSAATGSILTICDNNGRKMISLDNCSNASFTADSKHLVCNSKDGLSILKLSDMKHRIAEHATDFKIPVSGNGQFLFYKQNGKCILDDLRKCSVRAFSDINDISFNDQGTVAILKGDSVLIWLDLLVDKEYKILQGQKVSGNVQFDGVGTRIVFGIENFNGVSIYQYHPNLKDPEMLVDKYSKGIGARMEVSTSDLSYSEDGEFIFFKLRQQADSAVADVKVITPGVNIWNFKDKELQSYQINFNDHDREYLARFSLKRKNVIQLENDKQLMAGTPKNGFAILKNRISEFETYWNGESPDYKIISLLTGTQKDLIPSSTRFPELVSFSGAGNYITWYDKDADATFCYTIKTGMVKKLLTNDSTDYQLNNIGYNKIFRISGWLKDDVALIGHDGFDIWQIDPESKKRSVSITGDYGIKNGIQFRPVELLKRYSDTTPDDSILLTAMEVSTKYNGYKMVKLSKVNSPGSVFLGPYLYYFPDFVFEAYIRQPLKSNSRSSFLLQRQSDASPSNLFFTKDFVNYIPISGIKPLAGYKNYKSELIAWRNKSVQNCFGILYLPEDVDTSQKYPVIFNYYEMRSFGRYQHRNPTLSGDNINIPWYTSRGYAVFIPDIPRMLGKTGPVALETVESAVKYLINRYQWIDKNKIGLQGHSHGGYITNYIATHSNLFAAAQSSAGYSDFISAYGQLGFGDVSLQFMQEVGQNNLGTTPWKNPEVYIENSCIFSVDKVSTPLLIMHNKGDGVVRFTQAIELFTALRREKKPVWLLDYDNEDHVLSDSKHILDFCIRQQQFFDHYLKGMPAPEWMIEGVPAKYKGLKSGLQLDSLRGSSY